MDSIKKQGGSGLEAHRSAVNAYVANPTLLVAEFTDIESGQRNDRPQLLTNIAFSKQHGPLLLIANLDRFTRNVAFIFTLQDSGIEFVCAYMPEANSLTIGVMAPMGQHQR